MLLSVALLAAALLSLAGAALLRARAVRRSGASQAERRGPKGEAWHDDVHAFRLLADCSSDLVFLVDRQGNIAYASPSVERTFGTTLSSMRGRPFERRVVEGDRELAADLMARARRDGTARGTIRATTASGEVRSYDALADASRAVGPELVAISGRDVTEQVQLAAQLRQAQKLEAVGRLAAGVAHDFNNLLAVVQSGAALAREQLPPGHPAHADLADVATASDRGAALTRQLLSFSRKERPGTERCDVARVIAELAGFLPRLLGQGIRIHIAGEPGLGQLPISAVCLEQVLLNLVLNARDAMPGGGWIRVEARRVDLRSGGEAGLPAGPHVEIAVHDQGTGMDEAVRRRLFEPFFTTKEPGRGSGLGLATSRGIVEGAGGTIEVESEPGRGSVFRVLLPRLAPGPQLVFPTGTREARSRRSRVLLVDRDPAAVAHLSRLLAARGHEVIVAASVVEARQQAASFPGAVDVVLTSLVVGEEAGVAVLGEVRRTSPRVRSILVAEEVRHDADVDHLLESGVELVRGPVTSAALVEVVDRASTSHPPRRDVAMA